MGNAQTREEKDKMPEHEDMKNVEKEEEEEEENEVEREEQQEEEQENEEEEEEEEEERKASVTIIAWSNAERNARISEIKVEKDEMFVSTIFNVKIQEIEQKMDEDSAATSDENPSENEVQAVRSVLFKHNSRRLEETACIHSVVDSEDNEQSTDYITLSLEVQIAKNLVIYTFHQFNGRKWTKTEIEQKVGRSTVDVDVYDAFTTETIFFTMRYMCEDITVPSGGFEYENDFCTHQRITFPEGAVPENTKITVKTLSIEGECKKNRLKEEMGSETTISGLSDVVYVHHSQPFKKKVKLRLKLDLLFEDDASFGTYLFHCDDNGCLKVLDDVKLTRVSEEEVGGDQIYEVEVDTFSGWGFFNGVPTQDHTKTLSKTYDLGRDQCRVLVFLYKEENKLHLWSDIVPEKIWKEREKELDQKKGMVYLKNTVSPSVPVKNFSRLRITVLKHGRILAAPEVPANSTFMYYDRNAEEIFNHFPIVSNKGMRCETGIIQYEVDTAPKRLLHTAYFNAELYLVQPKQAPQTFRRAKTGIQRQTSRTQPGGAPTESPNNPNIDHVIPSSQAQQTHQGSQPQQDENTENQNQPSQPQPDGVPTESGANIDSVIRSSQAQQTHQGSQPQQDENTENQNQPSQPQPDGVPTESGANIDSVIRSSQTPQSHQGSQPPPDENAENQKQPSQQQPDGVPTESPANKANIDFFSEINLLILAREMPTSKIWELMIRLGLHTNQHDNFRTSYEDNNRFKTALLTYWSNEKERNTSSDIKIGILCTALTEVELTPIAEVVKKVFHEHRSLTSKDFSNN